MRGQTPDGVEAVAEKRRRMRDADLLADRDILMLSERLQGRPDRETAWMFKVSRQLVQFRLNRMPTAVQDGLARMVRDQRASQGYVMLSAEQLGALRSVLRRARGGKSKARRTEAEQMA